MLSEILNLLVGNGPQSPEGKLANELMGAYQRSKIIDQASDYFLGDEDRDLDRASKRLDIDMKRRALGLPLTSDDYEESADSGRPYGTTMTTLAGREVMQLIPKPEPMSPYHGKIPWERSAPVMDRGIMNAITGIGGKYASSIGGGIRRFIR